MKKLLTAFALTSAAVALASPASAAVTTGGRIEAIIGWDNVSASLEDEGIDESFDVSGLVYGVGVGYDFAAGNGASIGIDLEASETTADFDLTEGGDSATISAGRDLYAGGRITAAVSDSVNLYFKAGYTNLRVSADTDIDGDIESESTNLDGVRGGIGLQVAISPNSYFGTEYRYSNYEADVSRHQAIVNLGFRF